MDTKLSYGERNARIEPTVIRTPSRVRETVPHNSHTQRRTGPIKQYDRNNTNNRKTTTDAKKETPL